MVHAVALPAPDSVVRTHTVHDTHRRDSVLVPDGRGDPADVAGTVLSANGRRDHDRRMVTTTVTASTSGTG